MNNTLRALRQGNVPSSCILELYVGKDKEIQEFQHMLNMIEDGFSIVSFINSEYGGGKSHFLKIIEKFALKNNFIVSYVKILPNFHSNVNNLYRSILNSIHGKSVNSFEEIVSNWIAQCNSNYLDSIDENKEMILFNEWLDKILYPVKKYSPSFVSAIQYYNMFKMSCDFEKASSIIAWLSRDFQFSVSEVNINYDINIFEFLSALSCFIKLAGYSGLVLLFDDLDVLLSFDEETLMDFYDYIKYFMDYSNNNYFQSMFSVFAGTPEVFENDRKGIPCHPALDDMIKNMLRTDLVDMRKPIFALKGFTELDLKEMADKLIIMHGEVYNWNASDKINPILQDLLAIYIETASLTGGIVTPRTFIRSFISVLDVIQQNQFSFNDSSDILELFIEKDDAVSDFDFDDIDEFDDDW